LLKWVQDYEVAFTELILLGQKTWNDDDIRKRRAAQNAQNIGMVDSVFEALCNYTTMEKELLSIIETYQQYCHILLGSHCKFYCKHKNLGFHHFKSEPVRRWRATLEEFDYSFIYCPGKDNTIADMLSCYPMTSIDTFAYEEITTLQDSSFPATTFNIKQSQDTLPSLINKLSTSTLYTKI
jgi:RNase H-like domain found in reverse transcriptase